MYGIIPMAIIPPHILNLYNYVTPVMRTTKIRYSTPPQEQQKQVEGLQSSPSLSSEDDFPPSLRVLDASRISQPRGERL